MKSACSVRRFWIVSGWLLAGVAFGVHAQETKSRPEKPAPSATSATKPAADKTTADDEFLEFLGSVDSDSADEDWLDYLAQTDIRKVARAKKKTQAAESQPAPDKAGK